jgi:hypothetical protein
VPDRPVTRKAAAARARCDPILAPRGRHASSAPRRPPTRCRHVVRHHARAADCRPVGLRAQQRRHAHFGASSTTATHRGAPEPHRTHENHAPTSKVTTQDFTLLGDTLTMNPTKPRAGRRRQRRGRLSCSWLPLRIAAGTGHGRRGSGAAKDRKPVSGPWRIEKGYLHFRKTAKGMAATVRSTTDRAEEKPSRAFGGRATIVRPPSPPKG